MTETDRPEVDDPRVLALAQARQQMAHENQFNAGFCPPWDGLTEQEQRLSLLDARNYLRAVLKAGLLAPDAAVPSAPAARTALSAKLWAIAEHHIVAEWICCEPVDPKHELCAKGHAALGMARTLLVDSPEAWNPAAPLLDAVLAELLPEPADRAALREQVAALAEDLRYVLNYRGPGHAHDRPGVWDTSGKPCEHCARLAVAQRNLAAYDADAAAVLAVLPEPADRAAILREAADAAAEKHRRNPWTTAADVIADVRRMAGEAQQPASTAPQAANLPLVKGRCPACNGASLFLGDGGYVTCSRIDCPEPDAASTALEQPAVGAQQPETQAAADCPYGVGLGDGSGCIKPAGHDGDHVVTPGVPVVPCSRAVLHQPHIPHSWWPQPGMPYVHCPGPTPTP